MKSIKRMLSVLLSVIIVVSCVPVFAQASTSKHKMGAIPMSEEEIDEYLDNPAGGLLTLPKSCDLTSQFPTPGNQGNLQSCVAWAVSYACRSGQETDKRGWTANNTTHAFSPSYVYNKVVNGVDRGMSIKEALSVLKSKGACTMSYFPYDDSNCATQPTSLQNTNASLYKINNWCSVSGISAIKNTLARGKGVVITINVYPDFEDLSKTNKIYDDISGESKGWHSVCLIGYDDSLKAFKCINSWGTDWGDGGYGWISYKLMENTNVTGLTVPKGFYVLLNSEDNYLMGDVDNDGKVTATDARLVLRYQAKLETYTNKQFVLGDADGNGKLTASDAQAILQYSGSLIAKLPIYE